MQNRDKGRSDEDRSRGERSHESMRGNSGRSSEIDRSHQDRSPRTPQGEESDIERSTTVGRRHITGEGESIGDIPSDGSRSGSRGDERERGNGRSEN